MKKLILFDIDGVLNPNAEPHTPSHADAVGFHVWNSFKLHRFDHRDFFEGQQPFVNDYDITFSPEILDKVQALARNDNNTEVAFLSDWGESAISLFAKESGMALDKDWRSFEKFEPKTPWRGSQLVGFWWKHHTLEKLLTENPDSKVVFVDDRAMRIKGQTDYARITELLVENHSNLMVIVPNGLVGISRHEIDVLLHPEFFENKVFIGK